MLEHYGSFGLIFCVAILTPVIEEIIYRGVLLTAMTNYNPFAWASVIQAFAFMIVNEHGEVFPLLFCFGLICGFLRKASGGLLPSLLLHALHNGLIAPVLIFVSPWRLGLKELGRPFNFFQLLVSGRQRAVAEATAR